jgi:hypothetical protein
MTTTMEDLKPKQLSEAKWQRLIEAGAPLGLRDDARAKIESLIAWWRHYEVIRLDDDGVKPQEIRDAIEAAAKDLERALYRLSGPKVKRAVMDPPLAPSLGDVERSLSSTGRLPPGSRVPHGRLAATEFEAFMGFLRVGPKFLRAKAAKVAAGKSGPPDAENRRWMLRKLEEMADEEIRDSKNRPWLQFIGVLYEVAGCGIVSSDTINDDLKWLRKDRHRTAGEIAAQIIR